MEIKCCVQLFTIISFVADTITAIQDVWFVGDNFLQDIFTSFTGMRNVAVLRKTNPPYLFDFFNVYRYFQGKLSCVKGIARVLNAFIEGLNQRSHLPHFVVFILDKDMITQLNFVEFGISSIIKKVLTWLIRQVKVNLKRRRADLFTKKPGALSLESTKVIWVKMLKRPYSGQ